MGDLFSTIRASSSFLFIQYVLIWYSARVILLPNQQSTCTRIRAIRSPDGKGRRDEILVPGGRSHSIHSDCRWYKILWEIMPGLPGL